MAHFAKIVGNGYRVAEVIVVNNSELLDENGVEQEHLGAAFCEKLLGGRWVQTSYNGNLRKNFAGVGYWYDQQRDAFIAPQPYPSWTLDEDTCTCVAPVAYPDDGNAYIWDEQSVSWVEPQTEPVIDTIASVIADDTVIYVSGDDTIFGSDTAG